ncbi:hypothetical protein F2Q68_00002940 [Brassica cretica]|uniref:Uncharacterized protein n=1 Tax=Brassica cretica TaxID=69181 RepID=A0A8S9J9T3_BRACR|nr:hypothetical protein F2Q68_00002940 [Brassica cretica]
MLMHLSRSCPIVTEETQLPQAPRFPQTVNGRASYSQAPTTAAPRATRDSAFRTRVDRHGNPFGDRVQTQDARGRPLTNKITPTVPTHATHAPYPNRDSQRDHRDNTRQWREKQFQPLREAHKSTKTPPPGQVETSIINTSRPPLQRNLALHDFPTPTLGVPTREEVLNELREASYQYTNLEDPQERAAKQQRVLQTEMDGYVEEAATGIIATATHLMQRGTLPPPPTQPLLNAGQISPQQMEMTAVNHTPSSHSRTRGHHGKSKKPSSTSRGLCYQSNHEDPLHP